MKPVRQTLQRSSFALALSVAIILLLSLLWRGGNRPHVSRDLASLPAVETNLRYQPLWGVFHPVWKTSVMEKLSPLVHDPLGRTDPFAKVTDSLRPRVIFWMAIYGIFPSHHKVVHDRLHPDLIYGHIDLSAFSEHLNAVQAEILSKRIEKSVHEKLIAWIWHLIDGRTAPASIEETQLFRTFLVKQGFDSTEELRALATGIRTQSGQQDAFLKALERSKGRLTEIDKIFAEHEVPRHAARIPFVESSFNYQAKSKIGALGIWQFTPSTAKEWIDAKDQSKWNDPSEQAKAAARMLRLYRKHLPDWGTTITAYNSGITRLQRLVKRYRAKGIEGILDQDAETNGLGFAGENFYSEVLAATLIEAYKTEVFTPQLLEGMLAFHRDEASPLLNYCTIEGGNIDRATSSDPSLASPNTQGELMAQRLEGWFGQQFTEWKSRLIPTTASPKSPWRSSSQTRDL